MNILNFTPPVALIKRGMAARAARQQSRRQRAGFTLIEVAVALVIFVIGALAILRIFPPALAIVQGSESLAIATRLDKSTLATANSQPNLVPDAIYDSSVTAANPSPYDSSGNPIAVVGTSSRNSSIPPDTITDASFANSGLGHFQRIVGERPTVRQEENTTTGNPLYVLTRYAYNAATSSVNLYREGQVSGVRIHTTNETTSPTFQDGELDFTNATLASDPSVSFSAPANPRLPPTDMRYDPAQTLHNVTYYVSYSWQQGGKLQSVVDEPIRIGPSAAPSLVAQGRILAGTDAVLPGSVSVRFRYLFSVVDATAFTGAGQDPTDPYRGFVPLPQLNPGMSTGTPATLNTALQAGATVSLDYDVKDWRWLVQDDDPSAYNLDKAPAFTDPAAPTPGGTSRTINLPIHPLNDQQSVWLYSLMLAADSSTGQTALFRALWDTSASPATNNSSLQWADRKSGQVMYDVGAATAGNLFSPRVRTVYQTLDGWTHQLSVAARSYVPYYSGFPYDPTTSSITTGNIEEAWREYLWSGPGSITAAANTLYFHASEAGKSVLVSYRYIDGPNGGKVRDATAILTISDNIIGTPTAGFDPKGVGQAALTTVDGNQILTSQGSYVVSILSVQGADVRARTAWIDGNRYTQAAVAGYRNATQLQTN